MNPAELFPIMAVPAPTRDEHPGIASLGDRLRHLPVLVAVAREADALGALALAESLKQRYGTVIQVVRVATTDDEIVHYAREHRVALILTGLPGLSDDSADGSSHREATLAVAEHAHVPVLAVTPDLRGLPRRAVAAVDFAPTSIRAARAALDLLARPVTRAAALLRLLYVDDRTVKARTTRVGATLVTELGVQAAFERLIDDLEAPEYVRVDAVVRYGTVATELLRLAADSEADVIVVGARHRAPVTEPAARRVIGQVLRDASCSVLAVPPPY